MKRYYKVFLCGQKSGAERRIAHTVAIAVAIGAEILYFRPVIGAVVPGAAAAVVVLAQ